MTVPNLPLPQIGSTGVAKSNSPLDPENLMKLFMAGSEAAQHAAQTAFLKQQRKDDQQAGEQLRQLRLQGETTHVPAGALPGAGGQMPFDVMSAFGQQLQQVPAAKVPEWLRQAEPILAQQDLQRQIAQAPADLQPGLNIVRAMHGQPAEVQKEAFRRLYPHLNADDLTLAASLYNTGLYTGEYAWKSVFPGTPRPDTFPTGKAPVETPVDRAQTVRINRLKDRILNDRNAQMEAERAVAAERKRVENSLRLVSGVNLTPAQQAKADSTVDAFTAKRYPNLGGLQDRLAQSREELFSATGGRAATQRPGVTVTPNVPKRKITKDQQAYLQSIGQWDASQYEVVP